MGLKRWINHSLTSSRRVRTLLPPAAMERIGAAIARAESGHAGEIRFAVEAALPWSYLRRDAAARQRATMLFAKLRVWDTEDNNGVLLYVELADRVIEIVADRGIARVVSQSEWEAICDAIRDRFKAKDYEGGVIAGIEAIGRLLTQHFPLSAGQINPNELSDRPIVL